MIKSIRSCRFLFAKLSNRDALGQAMGEEIERDPKVFLIGEEVGVY